MTYDRTAYRWYHNADGVNKRFKTAPDTSWSLGRFGFSKSKVTMTYNFNTADCVPAMKRYGKKTVALDRTGRNEAARICEQFHGPRPEGFVVRHLCLNDSCAPNGFVCCNPDHIKWDSQAANVSDVIAKGIHISQTEEFHTVDHKRSGGIAATSKIRVCERCGHTGKYPSFGHHIRKCL